MNTEFGKTNFKDNVATVAIITAAMIAIFSSLVSSADASAGQNVAVQKMEAIVVTAPRVDVAHLDTIVVTASRETSDLLASN